jgi:hypothetical protein
MVRIDPTTTSQMKTSGILGYALTAGIASMGMKVTVSNSSARVRTSPQPTFYFFFDESRPNANSSSFMGASLAASSPNEFNLVQLERKGDHRETKVGKMNIGGAKMGVMDKDRLQFRYDAIRPGVFRVTPAGPLGPGEYGFLYSVGGAGLTGAMAGRIFDFGVEPGGAEPPALPPQAIAVAPATAAPAAPHVPVSDTPRLPAVRTTSHATSNGQSGFGNGRIRCVTC